MMFFDMKHAQEKQCKGKEKMWQLDKNNQTLGENYVSLRLSLWGEPAQRCFSTDVWGVFLCARGFCARLLFDTLAESWLNGEWESWFPPHSGPTMCRINQAWLLSVQVN